MNDFPWLIVNLEWYKYYQPQLEVNWNIFISKKMILHFIASIIKKWFLFQGNVERQLKNQCDKLLKLVIGLKVQHSPHFIGSFWIYAFVNFHLIKSITKQKWFISHYIKFTFAIFDFNCLTLQLIEQIGFLYFSNNSSPTYHINATIVSRLFLQIHNFFNLLLMVVSDDWHQKCGLVQKVFSSSTLPWKSTKDI